MRKITFTEEFYNDKDIIHQLEHTAVLMEDGQTEGIGWKVEGEEEREMRPEYADNDEPEPLTENLE